MSRKVDIMDITNNIQKDVFSSKNVLVTGGAGFLGSWICESLLELGSTVFCLDNFSTGLKNNIKGIFDNKNFHFVNSSVNEPFQIKQNCDLIIHMASRPSPEDYVKFPVDTLEANSKGTYNVLDLARKNDSKVIFASTSEVYGDPTVVPTPETYWGNVNPIGIRSCYDEGKRFSEALLMGYHRQYGLDTRIVRIFNTYGPKIRGDGSYGRALPRFILQAINNQNLTIYGDGLQTRSFCYVVDTIKGILSCFLSNEAKAIPINIGNSQEISIIDLAKMIAAKINPNLQFQFLERPNDDPQRRCPDISLAKKILNWEPKVDLESGLERTIAWFRNAL